MNQPQTPPSDQFPQPGAQPSEPQMPPLNPPPSGFQQPTAQPAPQNPSFPIPSSGSINYQPGPNHSQQAPLHAQQTTVNIVQTSDHKKPGNGMAVAGLVLGILAALFGMIPLIGAPGGMILALIGIPLSAVALNKSKKVSGQGKGIALTGLILGVCAILFIIIWAAIFAAGTAGVIEGVDNESEQSEKSQEFSIS